MHYLICEKHRGCNFYSLNNKNTETEMKQLDNIHELKLTLLLFLQQFSF